MKVVNLSSLVRIKGIEYFMLSYNFLRNKNSISYQIYGDGPLRKKLESIQNDNVKLMGFIDNPEEIIKESDVIVISSIIPEASPLVALESLKHGKPVIATNLGGQAEVVVDNYVGLHCLPRDPKSIADKIDLLYENPELYKKFSSNALEYSKKFSFKIFREKILEIFNTVPA